MKFKLDLNYIIRLHNQIIKISGGELGLQNNSNLLFALDFIRYNNTKSEFEKNLALLFRNITELHPFIDGNKRTGLMLIEIILSDNNLKLNLTNKEKEKLVLNIAMGKYSNLNKLSNFLKKNIKKM